MLGAELGGRVSQEALKALHLLAVAKARESPELLRRRAKSAWQRRWLGMLSVSIQVAVAESLLDPTNDTRTEVNGWAPAFSELPARGEAPARSRLPLR